MALLYNEIENNFLADAAVVTITGKNTLVHAGHIALFEFAKTICDKVIVIVTRNRRDWDRYLKTGEANPYEVQAVDNLVTSIEDLGLTVVILDPPPQPIDEKLRKEVEQRSKRMVDNFKKEIILDRVTNYCEILLMDVLIRYGLNLAKEVKYVVSSPELETFVIKAVIPYTYKTERNDTQYQSKVRIYSNIIADPVTGLRLRSTLPDLNKEQSNVFVDIKNIIEQIRPTYVKGDNRHNIEKLNNQFKKEQGKLWKFHEIAVFEDGIFEDFKLDLTVVEFRKEKGSALIEDVYVTRKE